MPELPTRPEGFRGFGPSILARGMRGRIGTLKLVDDRFQSRKLVRESCPTVPGIYGWLDGNGQLLYVGKSKSLRGRLLSYFNPDSDSKSVRIRQDSSYIVWEPITHELPALIREQELIHRWRPELNSMGQPTRMQPAFLCVSGSPVPNVRLVRRLSGRYLHTFGPIQGTGRLRESVDSLNQYFRLRDCPDSTKFEFANQQLLFDDDANARCIRYELGTCPGPCARKCSSRSYDALVQRAVAFLDGGSTAVLEAIESEMQLAASRRAFESAAIHRNRWQNLKWLDRRLAGLRTAERTLNGVLELPSVLGRPAWMLIRSGRLRGTMLRPRTERERDQAARLVDQCGKAESPEADGLLEMGLQLIVISWFRKFPETRKLLASFDEALSGIPLNRQPSAA